MVFREPDERSSSPTPRRKARKRPHDVTEARSRAQRTKLNAQVKARELDASFSETSQEQTSGGFQQGKKRTAMTLAPAIDDYLQDHEGGNHSKKTLEWHHTALNLLQEFLEKERTITLIKEVDAPDISAWFAYMRKAPGKHGKPRAERTIQTYARSVRAFFHWLVRREVIARNPFDRVVFPKVGKPLIQTIEPEEFEQLLLACVPPGESPFDPFAAKDMGSGIPFLVSWQGITIEETGLTCVGLFGDQNADAPLLSFVREHLDQSGMGNLDEVLVGAGAQVDLLFPPLVTTDHQRPNALGYQNLYDETGNRM